MRCSGYQGAFYSSGVACAHIEFLATGSAFEVIRRPYRSSRFSALYLAHSFSVRLATSGEAIPNRRNDRIVARTLMLLTFGTHDSPTFGTAGTRRQDWTSGPPTLKHSVEDIAQ